MRSSKEDRKVARILVKDFNSWKSCPPYWRIRVAETETYNYAIYCEWRSDYADWTLQWFSDVHEAKCFVLRHLGINLFNN